MAVSSSRKGSKVIFSGSSNAQQQEGHPACKKLDVGLLVVTFDWSFARLIAPVINTTSIILSSNKVVVRHNDCKKLRKTKIKNDIPIISQMLFQLQNDTDRN